MPTLDAPTRDTTDLSPTPLAAGVPFGVRVHGRSLATLCDRPALAAALRALVARERVVVIALPPDAPADPNDFVTFAATLGPVRPSRVPDTTLASPAREHLFVGRRPLPPGVVPPRAADAAHHWHTDYSQADPPPRLSMLQAVDIPPGALRTGFADMAAVYRALPQALKDEIDDLQAVHYRHPHGVDVMPPDEAATVPWSQRCQGTPHRLVQHDPAGTGAPVLFLPPHPDSAVVGRDEAASRRLLDALWRAVDAHGSPWLFDQAPGEVLIWDNRALLHRREALPLHSRRLTWFLTTA